MPAVLQDDIQDQIISKFSSDPNFYYNLFYLVYSWTNMIVSPLAGIAIDKYGRAKCTKVFLTCCIVGSTVYATGAYCTSLSPSLRYGLMFGGRFLFGLGGGPITICQNSYSSQWFKGHELALAFGCTLTISRIGSVLNFNATPSLYQVMSDLSDADHALGLTLFLGAGITFLSLFAAVSLNGMDARAMKEKRGPYKESKASLAEAKKVMSLQDVKEFGVLYWLFLLVISLFYSIVFPFMADSSSYLETSKFGLSHGEASFRASLVYMSSIVLSLALGGFVDWYGRRSCVALLGTFLAIPPFLLLAYTSIDPIVAVLFLGAAYSVCASSLWPSISLLVPMRTIGTANGLATSAQMFGIGISNVMVGHLRDATTFENNMLFFVILGVAATTVGALTIACNVDKERKLYYGKRDKKEEEEDKRFSKPLLHVDESDEPLV